MWRAHAARAQIEDDSGQTVKARRDREAAVAVLEEIAERLPRDLREVFWNEPRRRDLRAASVRDLSTAPTSHGAPVVGEDRLARVLEINRAIAGELDLDRLLERATDHAIALLRAERGFVILKSGYARTADTRDPSHPPHDLSIHASRDQFGDDPHARFSQSIAEQVISTGEQVVTTSARDDARMAGYLSVHQLMLQSVACVPIHARSGAVIGALYLETRLRPAASFKQELPTLTALADQVAIAIETARLVGENARRAAELEKANRELEAAHAELEVLLADRTAQLQATQRDLRSARAVIRGHFGYEGLVGTSEAMRRVYALIDRVKDTDVPVLITGESGTGKEMIARAIHHAGGRDKKPFLGINCGAIPEHLLESELFGHVRGAFTGADRDRKGLFREATDRHRPARRDWGDAAEDAGRPAPRPAGEGRPPRRGRAGGAGRHPRHRRHAPRSRVPGRGRHLPGGPLLPPPRHRGARPARSASASTTSPCSSTTSSASSPSRHGRERRCVSRAAIKRLTAFGWPGNVRQLENVLLNAWVLCDRPELDVDDFELPAGRPPRPPGPPSEEPARSPETSLDQPKAGERDRILSALARCNWNRVKAAEIVGLPRRTFYRRLKEYGIQ